MSSPFDSPVVRYGMGASSALILVFVGFSFLDGLARWVVLGFAVLEIVVAPQLMKLAT